MSQWRDVLNETGEPLEGAALGALLSAQAQRTPHASALTIDERTMTFAELDAAANMRARWFADLGVARGDAVLIAVGNGQVFYESVLACWKLGAVPAPVSHKLTSGEFAAIAGLCAPALIVRDSPSSDFGCLEVAPNDALPDSLSAQPLEPVVAASWKMATTGGSTGLPKLVVDAAPGSWGPEKNAIGRRSGMTVINPAPLYHAAPFGLVIPALLQGCHVIEMVRFDPRRWLGLAAEYRAQWAYMVPTMMTRIARLPQSVRHLHDISSLHTLLHLAAPCPEWVKRFWIDWIGADAIWEIYGGAERLGATLISGREWLAHPGSVGRPGEGTQVEIRSPGGEPLPCGEVGEIYMRRRQPGSTQITVEGTRPMGGDWATFGDLGRVDTEGYLYIADRRTDMIVSGGANLYPSEIEAALGTFPGVIDAVVIGLPDEDLGARAHAIVQLASSDMGAISDDDLLAHLAHVLARTKHPRGFDYTSETLRDDAGKVRRARWRDWVIARRWN